MNKIIKSLSVVAFVAAIAIAATGAYFSDTETSTGNTFTAGSIDLKVDSDCHYYTMDENGQYVDRAVQNSGTDRYECSNDGDTFGGWELTDLDSEKFFAFSDLKPGDKGENTISLHVYDNDAWACMTVTPKKNDDMDCTEPELEVGADPGCIDDLSDSNNTLWDGDLAQALTGMIWADMGQYVSGTNCTDTTVVPGDNKYNPECGDKFIGDGIAPYPAGPVTLALADKDNNVFTELPNDPLIGSKNYYIGVSWDLPFATGNAVQSDSYEADISFYTEQYRNNPNFTCSQ